MRCPFCCHSLRLKIWPARKTLRNPSPDIPAVHLKVPPAPYDTSLRKMPLMKRRGFAGSCWCSMLNLSATRRSAFQEFIGFEPSAEHHLWIDAAPAGSRAAFQELQVPYLVLRVAAAAWPPFMAALMSSALQPVY